ncbi:TRAP transporter large permease [Orrella sp. JC864]|uniref:TRAP transporter large permease n=1 Tax=Orrella sp. JC864 TaxID=3120298 RepID=UPI00300B2D9C
MIDANIAGLIAVALLAFLLVIGTQIGVALGLVGLLGITLVIGPDAALAQLATVPFNTTNSFTLAVIPLFIFMGAFATHAGLTTDLYRAAYNWMGRLPGGLAIATTLASSAFGAASGSTVVNSAVFTRIAMPEMTRLGYDRKLSAGCIAASGTLAALIPPSIIMVVYAIVTEQSISKMMLAGLVPAALTIAAFILGIYLRAVRNPALAPLQKAVVSQREKWQSLSAVWGISFLFLLVIGGIYTGLFTPTYAGAVGAFGAFLIALGKRRLNRSTLLEIIREASITTTTIFIIIIGGMIFSRFLTYTGLVGSVADSLLALELPPYVYLLAFIALYLVLGMVIEAVAIMIMTLPVMFPVLTGVGYDPIWLGIIAVKLAEIALITPPVGLNVYVVRSASPVPLSLGDVFRGVTPFVLIEFAILLVLILFPDLVTFIPDMME